MDVRRQDAEGGEAARADVGDGHAHLGRRPAGKAGNRHQAAHPLGHEVEAAPVAIRAGAAEPGDAGIHQPGIDLRQRLVAQTQAVHDAGPEVLRHDVRRLRHAPEHRLALVRAQVQGDAALVAVQRQEAAGDVVGQARTHAPRVVAGAGPLDLDDVGAHVGQQHGAHGAGHDLRQVQHFDAGQRAGGMTVAGSIILGHSSHLVNGARFDGRYSRTG